MGVSSVAINTFAGHCSRGQCPRMSVFQGKYEVVEELGSGSFGRVLKAVRKPDNTVITIEIQHR